MQHAILDPGLQQQCVPLLEQAVAANEAFPFMLAFLADRVLMEQGKPQIYGTQHVGGPETVDERRQAMGLAPLAERTPQLRTQLERELRQDSNKKRSSKQC